MSTYNHKSEKAIEAIQNGYFDAPFYQDLCARAGVRLSDVTNEEQFLKIPFMVKDDLRNSSPYLRTMTDAAHIYGLYSSNGTTGKKTFYVHSDIDHEKQAEFVRTYFTPIGVKPGGLGAVFGPIGSPIMGHCMVWQFRAMEMGLTLCPDPSPENILEVIESLPVTDVATLPQVASFLAARPEWREKARRCGVKRLLLGGDFLSDARRKLLEDTWDAEVYNCFGMSEVFGPLGNECRQQDGFHYIDKDLYIEIVSPDTGLPVKEGEAGVGVYTTLWKKGFPLLRYWSGDILRMIPGECACGCGLPRFDYFGRMDDCAHLPDGRWISPREVEEITLPAGLIHCQVRLGDDGSILFVYDEAGEKPTGEVLAKLQELFAGKSITGCAMPLEQMDLRGLKPKYIRYSSH